MTQNTRKDSPAKTGDSFKLNGHLHSVSGVNLSAEEGVKISFEDVQTKHPQTLTVPWATCRQFLKDDTKIAGQRVLFNGHVHLVVGLESKKTEGAEWLQIGLKDEKTNHTSALEIDKRQLAWRKKVAPIIDVIEGVTKLGGELSRRTQRAIEAFLRKE